MRVLVLGVSTRAMVESAVRGGHDVVAVDFFGDRDQARLAESYALERDLGLPATAEGLAAAARRIDADAVVYGSNLENHPEVIGELAPGPRLLGNPAEVVRSVRDWALLRRVCREAGIAHPMTLLRGEEGRARQRALVEEAPAQRRRPRDHRVGRQGAGRRSPVAGEVDGRAASVAFVADGKASSHLRHHRAAPGALRPGWLRIRLVRQRPAAPGLPGGGRRIGRAQLEHMVSGLTRHFGLGASTGWTW